MKELTMYDQLHLDIEEHRAEVNSIFSKEILDTADIRRVGRLEMMITQLENRLDETY